MGNCKTTYYPILLLILLVVPFLCSAQTEREKTIKLIENLNLKYIELRENDLFDSAYSLAHHNLKLSQQIKYKKGEAKSFYNIAIMSSIRGDFHEAIDTLNRAMEIFKFIGDKKDYSSALTVLGGMKNITGDVVGSLEDQLLAIKIKEEIGDSSNLAAAYSNTGNIYNSILDPKKALLYYKKALELNIKYQNITKAPLNYYNIAAAYTQLKNDSLSLLNAKKSVYYADSLGLESPLSYSFGLIARLELTKKRYESAKTYCLKAIEICEKIGDKQMLAANFQRMGSIYYESGDIKQSEKYFLKSLELSESIHYFEQSVELYGKLSMLYEKKEAYEKALFYKKKFKNSEDSLLNNEKEKEMIKKEMTFEFNKKEAEIKAEQEKKEVLMKFEQQQQQMYIWFLVIFISAILFIIILIFRNLLTAKKQKQIIELQKILVEEKQEEIISSIRYARKIQDALFTSHGYIERNIKRLRG